MKIIICFIGIILATVGTILSLWKVITSKSKDMGTVKQIDNIGLDFKKEKKWVGFGCCLIIVGNGLQIFSLFI